MNIVFWPGVISFVISVVLTWVVLKVALKYQLALPLRSRDVHSKKIPRIGGLAIFITFIVVSLIYQYANANNFAGFGFPFAIFGLSIDKRLLAVLVGALVLAIAMLYDDLKGLRAYQKLGFQILAALIVVAGGIGIRYINNPFGGPLIQLDQWQIPIALGGVTYHFVILADLLTIVWLVFLMNVLNFIDGIDGLAGTVSGAALLGVTLLSLTTVVNQPSTALLAVIALGSVCGFLVWNLPPARIFMGDTGSMFLGFIIGVLGFISGGKLATTAIVLAVPILDAILVILVRIYKHQNPFTHADNSHLHHRFLQAGFNVWQTLLILGGLSILFGLAAFQNSGMGKVVLFAVAVVIMIVLVAMAEVMKRRRLGGSGKI